MKNVFYILIIIVSTVLSSCYSTKVHSNKAKGVDLSKFNTYAWLPIVDTASGSLYYNEIVQENLIDQVNKEMRARNYSIDTANPDLLILLHLSFNQEQENVVRSYPFYGTYPYYFHGFSPFYWNSNFYPYYNTIGNVYAEEMATFEYTTGTLVIDIIQNSNDKLIWRGWSKERINPEKTSRELEEIVSEIFEKYPVEKQKELSTNKN